MRSMALTLCLVLAACSSRSESVPQHYTPSPDAAAILHGIRAAAADSHFDQPIEFTDPIKDRRYLAAGSFASEARNLKSRGVTPIRFSSPTNTFPRVTRPSWTVVQNKPTHPLKLS
jgi:hypothetical protein